MGEGVWLSSLPVFFPLILILLLLPKVFLTLLSALLSCLRSHSVAQAGWSRTHYIVQCDLEFKAFLCLSLPRNAGISGVTHRLEKDLAA